MKVTRPDVEVRFRRRYYDRTEQDLVAADVQNALRLPDAFEHAGLEVDAIIDRAQLWVISYLLPGVLRFTAAGGVNRGNVSLHALLRDDQGKLVGGKALFGRDVTLRLDDRRLALLLDSDNVELPIEVHAPRPGTYRLIVVARDSGGWSGSRTVTLTVPGT